MSGVSCSVDPLQRFATLANNNSNVGSINNSTFQGNDFSQRNTTEQAFFGNNEGNSSRHENVMMPSFIPITNNTDTNNINIHAFPYLQQLQEQQILVNSSGHNGDNDDNISNIFSNVKIHDPLEFSDEYKRFYGNFQNQNNSNTHSSSIPVLQRPSIQRFSQFNSQQSHIRQSNSCSSTPSTYGTAFQLDDNESHMIDHELDILHNELNHSSHHQLGSNAFDLEQTQFKEVAASIVDVMTPETTRSSSPVNTKLGSSKFMDLMKRVSAGSVTLRRDSPELFTPETDEVVGNEYFPVQDQPHKP